MTNKTSEATGELIGNKITDKIVRPDENSKNVKEIIIPSKK